MVTSGDGGQVPIGIPVGLCGLMMTGALCRLQEDLHNLSYVRIISTVTLNSRRAKQMPEPCRAQADERAVATGVQTPGQRVLVNVLPLFLIFSSF